MRDDVSLRAIRKSTPRSSPVNDWIMPCRPGASVNSPAGLNVLIVDDELDERHALIRLLALHGFQLHTVRSGADALTCTRSSTYQAIVLDLHLPDVLGVNLLSQWRREGLHVPVVVVTGWYVDTGHDAAVRALGAVAFIHKPLDAADLAAAIDNAVQQAPFAPNGDSARVADVPCSPRAGLQTDLDVRMAALHEDVLCGDLHAADEIWVSLLRVTEAHLRSRRIAGATDEHIHDAAVDALLAYAADPGRYDATKSPLPAYLCLAARHNLINLLQSERRRALREAAFASTWRRSASNADLSQSGLLGMLIQATKDFTAAELAVLRLWLAGERDTRLYANVLSLADGPQKEIRARVRCVKERVIRRLQRWASRLSPG
jgi:CheY-like chemotaxis protein